MIAGRYLYITFYVSMPFNCYEQATVRTRRAQDCFLLAIPPISKTCAASFFERSFIYAAPTLWNQLSIDIRMLEFNQFKSRVKTELYLKYFEP